MRDAQDRLFKSFQTQDLFVPEGSVSAVTTSITKLHEDLIQAQARRIALEAALKQVAEMKGRQEELDAVPQVATDAVVAGFNAQIAGLTVELARLGEKYKEGHPEVQKIQAQLEQLKKARQARASQIVDGAARRVRAAPEARGGAARRDRRPEGRRPPTRAARRPSSRRSRRRRSRRRASTRCCCRSSTRPTSRPRSAATT